MYKYQSLDPLKDRINYSYASFQGMTFVDEWFLYRRNFLKDGIVPDEVIETLFNLNSSQTEVLFSTWIKSCLSDGAIHPDIYLVIKRFEVTKRLFNQYDQNYRTIIKNDYHNLNIYLQFGVLLTTAYSLKAALPFVNALIKLLDTMCSSNLNLTDSQQQALSYLVLEEKIIIESLAQNLQVNF